MSWKDSLRQASFRGVEFFVTSSSKPVGRRVVSHEFPNRETPYTEDLGRIAGGYELEGHLIGEDYDKQKKLLEDAFNKYGPGELIHPFDGSQIIQVGPADFKESISEGGVLSFTVKVFEAGENAFPKAVNDKEAILNETTDNALAEAKIEFDTNFSIKDMAGFAIDSAVGAVELAQQTFDDATKTLADVADATASLAYATRNLVADVNDLLQSPSVLSQRLLDSFSLMENTFSSSKEKTGSMTPFFTFGDDTPTVDSDTPIRLREKENKAQLDNFIKRVACIKAANNAQYSNYESLDAAEEKRIEISEIIEAQIQLSTSDDFIQAMYDVSAALVESLPNRDSDIPSLKKITLDNTVSSLEIAYDLFEDPEKEQDIIDRNSIANPCFITEGSSIEVING